MALTTRMVFGGLVLAVMGISGCQEECTEVDCVDSITVTFDHAIARDYKVDITFNEQHGTADCSAATHPGTDPVEVDVLGLDGIRIDCRPNGALLQGAPEHVVIVFELPDGGKANIDVKPKYQDVTPNGPECGPVCNQAEVKVAIPADA